MWAGVKVPRGVGVVGVWVCGVSAGFGTDKASQAPNPGNVTATTAGVPTPHGERGETSLATAKT
jgi:hypothetical protein